MSASTGYHLSHSQNFLRSRRLVDALIQRANIGPDDLVVEVGPGRGIITECLAARCRAVVAIEKDDVLATFLDEKFADVPNVRIVHGDFLAFALPRKSYKVFASIPFDVTSAIVGKLTSGTRAPDDAFLVVQKEAAERFMGDARVTLPSILLKPWFAPTIVHHFRRTDFAPIPQVDVVMLRLRKRGPPLIGAAEAADYRNFVSYCFSSNCPTVGDTLRTLVGERRAVTLLHEVKADRNDTPSRIPFSSWLALYHRFDLTADTAAFERIHGSYRRLIRQQATLVKVHRTRPPPPILRSRNRMRTLLTDGLATAI